MATRKPPKEKSNGRASLATIINGRFDELGKRLDKRYEYEEDTRAMVVGLATEFRNDRILREARQKEADGREVVHAKHWVEVKEGIEALQKRNSAVDSFFSILRKVVVYGAVVLGGLATIFGVLVGFFKLILPMVK